MSFTFSAMPSMIILCLKLAARSTQAISCDRSTENDGMKRTPFRSITSFAKSTKSRSDSALGVCTVCEYVLSVISMSISPTSRSASRSIRDPFVFMSPV